MIHSDQDLYRRLRGSVRMLSSPAPEQVAYLKASTGQAKYPVSADDITTEFDCWLTAAARISDPAIISSPSMILLSELSRQIDLLDYSDTSNWTIEALEASTDWAAIRTLAKDALASMDAHYPTGALVWANSTQQ